MNDRGDLSLAMLLRCSQIKKRGRRTGVCLYLIIMYESPFSPRTGRR